MISVLAEDNDVNDKTISYEDNKLDFQLKHDYLYSHEKVLWKSVEYKC